MFFGSFLYMNFLFQVITQRNLLLFYSSPAKMQFGPSNEPGNPQSRIDALFRRDIALETVSYSSTKTRKLPLNKLSALLETLFLPLGYSGTCNIVCSNTHLHTVKQELVQWKIIYCVSVWILYVWSMHAMYEVHTHVLGGATEISGHCPLEHVMFVMTQRWHPWQLQSVRLTEDMQGGGLPPSSLLSLCFSL